MIETLHVYSTPMSLYVFQKSTSNEHHNPIKIPVNFVHFFSVRQQRHGLS